MKKILFWNVDTQYDFMRESYEVDGQTREGKLPVPGAEQVEDNLEQLTDHAYENGIQVVNTADWHNEDTEEISENPDYEVTFPEHCMQGTKGAQYVPATEPRTEPYTIAWQDEGFSETAVQDRNNLVVYKDKFDVFAGNPHTSEMVDAIGPENVVVYGVATDVCVDQAINGLLDRDINVYAVEDAMAGLGDEDTLEETMKYWKEDGAEIVTTADILREPQSGHAREQIETLYLLGEEDDRWLESVCEEKYPGYMLQLKQTRENLEVGQ